MARRRAQSARAADKALRARRRAVAAAAPWQVDSVSGQRLRPPDFSGAAAHVRRTGNGRPARVVPLGGACAKLDPPMLGGLAPATHHRSAAPHAATPPVRHQSLLRTVRARRARAAWRGT